MKINKPDKPLAILIKKKEKSQIIISGMQYDITKNRTDIKRIIKCYKQFYADKFNKLDEIINSLKHTNYQK